MSLLILTLPLADGASPPEYRYTLSHDGQQVAQHGRASAALLPSVGRAAGELVALVPVQALSWHRAQLPPGVPLGSPRMRAVLEGLLEDQLLDDLGNLHFALAPGAAAGSSSWVAVCDRKWLRSALQALEAQGRRVARVVPEFAPGAQMPSIHAIGTPEQPVLVLSNLSQDGALVALPLAPATLALIPQPPAGAEQPFATAEPAVAGLAEQLLGGQLTLLSSGERALHAARSPWDLAQFDLANSGRTRALRKAGGLLGALLQAPQWRAARWAIGVLLLAQLVGLNAWAWKEEATLQAKRRAVRDILTLTFPHVKVVADAPLQMQRELALLRQASGALAPADLEPLLAAAGGALAASGSASALDFTPGALRIRGITLSPEAIVLTANALQAQGYALTQEDDSLWLRTGVRP